MIRSLFCALKLPNGQMADIIGQDQYCDVILKARC